MWKWKWYRSSFFLILISSTIPISGQPTIKALHHQNNIFKKTFAYYKNLYARYQQCKKGICTAEEKTRLTSELNAVKKKLVIIGATITGLVVAAGTGAYVIHRTRKPSHTPHQKPLTEEEKIRKNEQEKEQERLITERKKKEEEIREKVRKTAEEKKAKEDEERRLRETQEGKKELSLSQQEREQERKRYEEARRQYEEELRKQDEAFRKKVAGEQKEVAERIEKNLAAFREKIEQKEEKKEFFPKKTNISISDVAAYAEKEKNNLLQRIRAKVDILKREIEQNNLKEPSQLTQYDYLQDKDVAKALTLEETQKIFNDITNKWTVPAKKFIELRNEQREQLDKYQRSPSLKKTQTKEQEILTLRLQHAQELFEEGNVGEALQVLQEAQKKK